MSELSDGLFCRDWDFENRGGEIWVRKGESGPYEELFAADVISLIESLRGYQSSKDEPRKYSRETEAEMVKQGSIHES